MSIYSEIIIFNRTKINGACDMAARFMWDKGAKVCDLIKCLATKFHAYFRSKWCCCKYFLFLLPFLGFVCKYVAKAGSS